MLHTPLRLFQTNRHLKHTKPTVEIFFNSDYFIFVFTNKRILDVFGVATEHRTS